MVTIPNGIKFCLSFILCLILNVTHAQNAEELAAEGLKLYEWESGIITYDISGSAVGSATFAFDLWGMKEAHFREMEYFLYGMKSLDKRSEIRDGDVTYKINLKDSTGTRSSDKTINSLLRYKTPEKTIEALYISMGGQIMGKSTFMDKECVIWKMNRGSVSEIWSWKGLILKSKRKVANLEVTYSATDLQLDVENLDEKFMIPESIKFTQ